MSLRADGWPQLLGQSSRRVTVVRPLLVFFAMAKRMAKSLRVEPSSGSVFAELGLPDAAELDLKVGLAVEINRLIETQRLTRAAAAKCLEVSQAELWSLKNYRLDDISVARLIGFLLALGQDIEIRVTARETPRAAGRIAVVRLT